MNIYRYQLLASSMKLDFQFFFPKNKKIKYNKNHINFSLLALIIIHKQIDSIFNAIGLFLVYI